MKNLFNALLSRRDVLKNMGWAAGLAGVTALGLRAESQEATQANTTMPGHDMAGMNHGGNGSPLKSWGWEDFPLNYQGEQGLPT